MPFRPRPGLEVLWVHELLLELAERRLEAAHDADGTLVESRMGEVVQQAVGGARDQELEVEDALHLAEGLWTSVGGHRGGQEHRVVPQGVLLVLDGDGVDEARAEADKALLGKRRHERADAPEKRAVELVEPRPNARISVQGLLVGVVVVDVAATYERMRSQ